MGHLCVLCCELIIHWRFLVTYWESKTILHFALYDYEARLMFSEMNIFQENEESRTDAVSGEGDLIIEELRDIHLCSCACCYLGYDVSRTFHLPCKIRPEPAICVQLNDESNIHHQYLYHLQNAPWTLR